MAKLKLKGKHLKALGYPQARVIGIALQIVNSSMKDWTRSDALELLGKVLEDPESYLEDELVGEIAAALVPDDPFSGKGGKFELISQHEPFPVFGREGIDKGAFQQMYTAMRLPVTVKGALMPDAHHGYGLPIGGVLGTENAVIPYGVGVDIGCRMCLSLYDLPVESLQTSQPFLKNVLLQNSRFGQAQFDDPMDDPVFEHPAFKEIKFVKTLKQKAFCQIGSSGGGNHFVEFGEVKLTDPDNEFGLPTGNYFALLTHSGSRGLGANIARHYTQIAMEKCRLPKEARHLAWLSLDSDEGLSYWMAMQLAGDYASANHHHIHHRVQKALGAQQIARVENHHNFAWKEKLPDGRELIVHRKGATPAGKGVLGVIPGSMTAPGFIVRGKGEESSLKSASHGAGRQMSRSKAKAELSPTLVEQVLNDHGIELIGGGLDEAPMAYKDIHQVMESQNDLVEVLGLFYPKIVRMEG